MDKKKSIHLLNKAAADELQAIHQYMYFHFHLADQGFGPLAALFKRIAVQEMMHLEALAERILYLKGDVDMTPAGPVAKETDAAKMLAMARELEDQSARDYNQSAMECAANADAASKQIFEGLIASEEEHNDIFDKQLENIERFGPNYLALQSFAEMPKETPPK